MSASTNSLVARAKKLALPGGVVAALLALAARSSSVITRFTRPALPRALGTGAPLDD